MIVSSKAIIKYNGHCRYSNTSKCKYNLSSPTNKVNGDESKKCNNFHDGNDSNRLSESLNKHNLSINNHNMHSNATTEYLSFNDIPIADSLSRNLPSFLNSALSILTWKNFHKTIDKRHKQYGPIFRQMLGPADVIFIKSPNLMRDVFSYEGRYPKHPLPVAWTFYNQLYDCKRGLFFMDDEEWLQTRKLLAPLMLRNENRFNSDIEKASQHLIENLKQNTNQNEFVEAINLIESLYLWSIHVLLRIMFGKFADEIIINKSNIIDKFANTVKNVFEDTVPFMNISPQIAKKFHLNIWHKFEESVTSTLSIADNVIDYGLHLNKYDGLLNDLMEQNVTEKMIKRIFIDLIIAAGDTTAFTTQWALYLLSQNIERQTEVRAEIKQLIRQRDTPLVRGTVREALRMYPVATFIGRILGTDAILDRYKIDKHTMVLISTFSAGRDELSFPKPNQFMPSRWNRDPITGSLKCVKHPQSSIPYALGARNCIGQRIANSQMQIFLTKFLKIFEIKLLNDKPIDTVMELIMMPNENIRFGIKQI